jgi:hypothetical protein
MSYGIILWGNSSYTMKLFRIQKKIIRIMIELKNRESCRESFKEMKILSSCSQYIYSMRLYILNNIHLFIRNTEVHYIVTRKKVNPFVPSASFAEVQKGVYY